VVGTVAGACQGGIRKVIFKVRMRGTRLMLKKRKTYKESGEAYDEMKERVFAGRG